MRGSCATTCSGTIRLFAQCWWLMRLSAAGALMEHWEQDMREQGYGLVMTSTQVNEEAQHFYRKLGYRDCGGFVVDIPGYEQPMEMIMIKAL